MSKSEIIKNQAEPSVVSNADINGANDNAQKDYEVFDKEAQINLDKERLTYICDYCGKVNSIDQPRCSRCGKRRPRNEYIKAVSAVRDAKKAKAEYQADVAAKEEEYIRAQESLEKNKERILSEKEAAQKMTMVRLVEERVADEKQKMQAQEEVRVDQEREYAKKMAAREAVLQVIAAEKVADEMIHQTKKETAEIISEKEAENENLKKDMDKIVSSEREKAINIAAERLVAERAGIEKFATEQIELNKQEADRQAKERILADRDEAEKMAARRAVLQIIAAEKAAEDELNLNREALSRAALKRIEEEKELAHKEASAKYLAERHGIERAAEERIYAEREAIKRLLEEKKALDKGYGAYPNSGYGAYPSNVTQTNQVAQPFVIVPYVDSNHPLLQYKPTQLYRFVPNTYAQQVEVQDRAKNDLRVMQQGPRPTAQELDQVISDTKSDRQFQEESYKEEKKRSRKQQKAEITGSSARTRLISLFTALLIVGLAIVLWFIPLIASDVYSDTNTNLSIFNGFLSMFQDGINGIIGTELSIFPTNSYVTFIRDMDFMGGVLLPFGLFISLVFYVLLFIKSIIRLITGRAKGKGIFLPILGLIFVQFITAGFYLLTKALEIDLITNIQLSLYITEGISIIIFILSLFNRKTQRK